MKDNKALNLTAKRMAPAVAILFASCDALSLVVVGPMQRD